MRTLMEILAADAAAHPEPPTKATMNNNDTGNGYYYITVTFSRSFSDDSDLVGDGKEATTEQLLEQFALELQGTYADPVNTMAGHWDIQAFNGASLSLKQKQAVSQGAQRACDAWKESEATKRAQLVRTLHSDEDSPEGA